MVVFNIEQTLKNADNDESLAREVAQIFLEDSGQILQQLIASYRADNSEESCQHAHTLKGMAGNLGADELWSLCEEAENFARARCLSRKDELISEIQSVHAKLCQAIKNYLG